jgi:hypothetical protein
MKRIVLGALLCAALSGAAFSQTEPARDVAGGTIEIAGVVEANTVDSITVRADSGGTVQMAFDRGTVGALGHPVGSRVEARFHHDELGQPVADEIRALAGGTAVVAAARSYDTAAPAETLPRSASSLPLLGLLGLLSISAATLVRAAR